MPNTSQRFAAWATALKSKKRPNGSKPGIRSRIMLYLVLFVAFIIVLLWVFQFLLLDDFYRAYKQRSVSSTAEILVQNLDNADIAELADYLCKQNDVCVLLLDDVLSPVFSVDQQQFCLLHHMSSRDYSLWASRAAEQEQPLTEFFAIDPFSDSRHFNASRFFGPVPQMEDSRQTMTLLYARHVTFQDGTGGTLMLGTLITPVTSTVQALTYQLFAITCIVLVAALMLAFLISRKVSRPIIETSAAARTLSRGRYVQPPHAATYREIAELNETLDMAAQELNQVEHLQHELIANVSHDLRTPLTMIGGYAEMMRDMPDETTPENMQIIIDESARLSTLVNELLDFSKLQTGSAPMTPTVFDLTASAESIITRIGHLVAKDGYDIQFAPSEHLFVTADEHRVGQVIYNLIGNALTYTGADKRVTVQQEKKENYVRISVADTGKGIPAEELPRIWNRYYRTKESHKRAIVGSGLGLNIVQTILEQHCAPYGVDSTEGKGTTFWFELPLADAPTDVEACALTS